MLFKMKVYKTIICVSAIASLTGCDYFLDNWEVKNGRCQSLSSNDDALATIGDGGVGFIRLENGCPDNLDILGSRFANIDINGNRYTATLMCNDATSNRTIAAVGIPDGIPAGGKGDTSSALYPRAIKEFSAFMGAKVTIEGETFKFSKGNFSQACRAYLPGASKEEAKEHRSFWQRLLGQDDKEAVSQRREETAPDDAQAKMMKAAGYVFKDGQWQKKSSQLGIGDGPAEAIPGTRYQREQAARARTGVDVMAEAIGSATSTGAVGVKDRETGNDPHKLRNSLTERKEGTDPEGATATDTDGGRPAHDGVLQANSGVTRSDPEEKQREAYPVNANCQLDNGKYIYAYASPDGKGYSYSYLDKNEKQELELKDGLFGVSAFHYHAAFGMGSADYLRFNKGNYDYLIINKDNGKDNVFHGLQVYKNGTRIFSHQCTEKMDLDLSAFPANTHVDSDDKADYFIYQ